MTITPLARFWLLALGIALLVPVAGLPLQATADLETFHNRTLNPWPSGKLLWSDPAHYFRRAQRWLDDRPWPIIQATNFKNNLLYAVLDTLPQRRVSQGSDGFLFLTGTDDDARDNILNDACIATPALAADHTLEHALADLAGSAHASGYPIDVLLVPTLVTIYGDRLPRSIPGLFRHACADIAAGRSPLRDIRVPGITFVYPLTAMEAGREDEAFFPKANYHPYGLSLTVVRTAYLNAIGANAHVDETLTLQPHLSETLSNYNIARYPPAYEVLDAHVKERDDIEADLNGLMATFTRHAEANSHAYDNAGAANPESIMIVSDSYGDSSSEIMAGAFRHVRQVHAPDERVGELVTALARRFPFQRLLLLFNEGNAPAVVAIAGMLHRPS